MQELQPSVPRSPWIWTSAPYVAIGVLVSLAWLGNCDVVSMEDIVADGARSMFRGGDRLVPQL